MLSNDTLTGTYRRPSLKLLGLGIVMALSVNSSAWSQENPAAGQVKEACAGDVKTLCSDVKPGGGRILACLKENKAKVSPGCIQALQNAKAAQQAHNNGS